jgi:hypothetical protein
MSKCTGLMVGDDPEIRILAIPRYLAGLMLTLKYPVMNEILTLE